MPIAAEKALTKVANKHKNWSDVRKRKFIYGTLRHKFHWKPEREKE